MGCGRSCPEVVIEPGIRMDCGGTSINFGASPIPLFNVLITAEPNTTSSTRYKGAAGGKIETKKKRVRKRRGKSKQKQAASQFKPGSELEVRINSTPTTIPPLAPLLPYYLA
jgi:hypothetical protein